MAKKESVEKKRCFVIGPIGSQESPERAEADWLLDDLIRPVLEGEKFGYKVTRADEIAEPGLITDQIISNILEADLIIADLTRQNANAFYELGVAHAYGKPVVHMAEFDETLPFDVQNYRAVKYSRKRIGEWQKAKSDLEKQVAEIVAPRFKTSNPVTAAIGFRDLAESGDTKDQLLANLSQQVERLATKVENISSSQSLAGRYDLSPEAQLRRLARPLGEQNSLLFDDLTTDQRRDRSITRLVLKRLADENRNRVMGSDDPSVDLDNPDKKSKDVEEPDSGS